MSNHILCNPLFSLWRNRVRVEAVWDKLPNTFLQLTIIQTACYVQAALDLFRGIFFACFFEVGEKLIKLPVHIVILL